MAVKRQTPSSKPSGKARQCRFIVRSAEEAVQRVRETLGPEARVVSVKQVKGEGLQRFLSAPRLEIVARVEAPEPEEPAAPPEEPAAEQAPPAEAVPPEDPPPPVAPDDDRRQRLNCGAFLERAGLPPVLLGRLEADADWRELCAMELRDGLPRVVKRLRDLMRKRPDTTLPDRAAFLGGPGAGKTTALCKLLARDVFLNGKRPQVLRLELDKPHLDDGLLLYCDVLGVSCTRSADEIDFSGEATIYVDIPGFGLTDHGEQDRIRQALEALSVDARILVLNAAYDPGILRKFSEAGRRLEAGFQILTHLDELESVGKLWPFLFDPDCRLLFFSNGQNVASDRVDDPFGYLIENTFPR
jgi:flagellar biosynthesis protein FlhF